MVGEGSPLHRYNKDYEKWAWKMDKHAENYELLRNHTSDYVTFRGYNGADHWSSIWGDLVNPASVIQDGIDLAEVINTPGEPSVPSEVEDLFKQQAAKEAKAAEEREAALQENDFFSEEGYHPSGAGGYILIE